MSQDWANRERNTNYLIRKLAHYLFVQGESVTPKQLHGLSMLSWITKSFETSDAGYIRSTKIPALSAVFEQDFTGLELTEIGDVVAGITEDESIKGLVVNHSGFTNFYSAYRNSSLQWFEDNFDLLKKLYANAYLAKNMKDREAVISMIQQVPKIPNPAASKNMNPENFLTPVLFCLDKEIRFPLINGNSSVTNLLKLLNVERRDLLAQFRAMVSLYGTHNINDAADLDQVSSNFQLIVNPNGLPEEIGILQPKDTNGESELPPKDAADIEFIRASATVKQRRIHNQITNKLLKVLSKYTLLEGRSNSCMFDVLVQNFFNKQDLIIEVKSSLDRANTRMAIGQLYDYQYSLNSTKVTQIALLLPSKPNDDSIHFLKHLDIGLMWFNNDTLETSTPWLEPIADFA